MFQFDNYINEFKEIYRNRQRRGNGYDSRFEYSVNSIEFESWIMLKKYSEEQAFPLLE